MRNFLRSYFSWRGRLTRTRYLGLSFVIFLLLVFLVCLLGVSTLVGSVSPSEKMFPLVSFMILTVSIIASMWCSLCLHVKRLHDMNFRGWWLLIMPLWVGTVAFTGYVLDVQDIRVLVNLLAWCPSLLLFVIRGTTGLNRFGEDPRKDRVVSQSERTAS